MTHSLVSIIIPCFNAEKWVGSAIRSSLAQSYAHKEIIVVDDGSSDNSAVVIASFGDAIHYEKHTHGGAPAARNRGLRTARGDWIQFLDADDQLAPEKLAHQVELVTNQGSDANNFIAAASTRHALSGRSKVISPFPDPWIGLIKSQLGNTCANLFSRGMLERIGGWDESLGSSQEYDLMFRLLKNGARVLVDPAPLTEVYDREESISRNPSVARCHRWIGLRVQIRDYLVSQGLLTSEREEAVKEIVHSAARWLYQFDKQEAVALHNALLGNRYVPNHCPRIYRVFYRSFGFRWAEYLYGAVRRLRGTHARMNHADAPFSA